jgi:hypothetical protein
MKKRFSIPLLIVVYLLCSARSCNDNDNAETRENRKITQLSDSLQRIAKAENPSAEDLHAAELSARQKLLDLADYCRIVYDTATNPVFREKAANRIRSLFVSEMETVNFSVNAAGKGKTLQEWLTDGLSGKYQPLTFSMDSVEIDNPLSRVSDKLYSGRLKFRLSENPSSERGIRNAAVAERSIEFYNQLKSKAFGSDTLNVWTLGFGKMK